MRDNTIVLHYIGFFKLLIEKLSQNNTSYLPISNFGITNNSKENMKLKSSFSILALVFTLVFTSCGKDDAAKAVILQSDEYTIFDVANSGISGKVTFTQEDNGSTHVLIELNGADTSTNPAYINFNSAAEGGDIAITLEVCTCSISDTTITNFDNGNPITYEGLLSLNGHITILDEMGNIVAVADIGSNSN